MEQNKFPFPAKSINKNPAIEDHQEPQIDGFDEDLKTSISKIKIEIEKNPIAQSTRWTIVREMKFLFSKYGDDAVSRLSEEIPSVTTYKINESEYKQ